MLLAAFFLVILLSQKVSSFTLWSTLEYIATEQAQNCIADRFNTEVQWSALELSEKLNSLPLAQSANFHVDSNALQHGFSLFQQILNKRGTLLIPVGTIKDISPFGMQLSVYLV